VHVVAWFISRQNSRAFCGNLEADQIHPQASARNTRSGRSFSQSSRRYISFCVFSSANYRHHRRIQSIPTLGDFLAPALVAKKKASFELKETVWHRILTFTFAMARVLASLLLAASLLAVPSTSRTLFGFEQRQLTRQYVASLSEEDQQLFGFDDQLSYPEANTTDKRCRYAPGDGKWPSDKGWQKLSKQLSSTSALIPTTPQASVCYGTAKNDAKCQELTKSWSSSYTHIDDPTEILSPIYQGLTCQPPSIYDSKTCTVGGYPSYVIKANTVLDIQLGINFARNDNIRLVVKNTGHDFSGKSTGAGSLSIWTHGLKDMQFFDNYMDDSGYKGPAVKAGAGVQAFELYKAANEKGLVVIAGEGQVRRS